VRWDIVLCGARHVPWVWKLNNLFVVNAGTACSNKIKARTTQCYNFIEIEKPVPVIPERVFGYTRHFQRGSGH